MTTQTFIFFIVLSRNARLEDRLRQLESRCKETQEKLSRAEAKAEEAESIKADLNIETKVREREIWGFLQCLYIQRGFSSSMKGNIRLSGSKDKKKDMGNPLGIFLISIWFRLACLIFLVARSDISSL